MSDKVFSEEKTSVGMAANGEAGKLIIPVFDPLSGHEVPVSVFMGNDGGAFRIQPVIAVRMVEVPVGIDQVFDRIAAQAIGSLQGYVGAML